jgi:hypothetical protein
MYFAILWLAIFLLKKYFLWFCLSRHFLGNFQLWCRFLFEHLEIGSQGVHFRVGSHLGGVKPHIRHV